MPARQAGERIPPQGVLIFLHIPKTAGSTMLRILERNYGRDAVLSLYDSTFGDEVAAVAPEKLVQTRVIAGHFYFGVHSYVPGPCRYLTFLRDPVERVVSHYHFVRRDPEHYLHPAASSMTLPEYVSFCGAFEPNNDQTRLLAGREMASGNGSCSTAMLPAAKRNLDSHAAVGLTEAFDASLILMRRLFGWEHLFYVRRNVAGPRPPLQRLPDEVRELIRAYNAMDVELYGYGVERFERQVAMHGNTFAREVRVFRQLNPLYGKLHRLASRPFTRLRATCG